MKPNSTSESISAAKLGFPQGALVSHWNRPLPSPWRRCATSTEAGTVMPWIIEASTARYMP